MIAIGEKNCTLSLFPSATYVITRWKSRSARSSGPICEMSGARPGAPPAAPPAHGPAAGAAAGAGAFRKFCPTMNARRQRSAIPATDQGRMFDGPLDEPPEEPPDAPAAAPAGRWPSIPAPQR